jgi:hypothetical protein
VRELVLVGETGRRDGLKPLEESFVSLVASGDSDKRIVGELVVVAIVAERAGALGRVLQIGLVLLFEKRILRSQALGRGFRVLGENGNGCRNEDDEQDALVRAHKLRSLPEGSTIARRK